MKAAPLRFAALAAGLALTGCGPGVPPVGNYATITGTVRDAATGLPITGAIVSVSVISSIATGANGVYKVYPIPTGPYTAISATAPNYQPYANNAGGTLAPGQTLSLDISMTHS